MLHVAGRTREEREREREKASKLSRESLLFCYSPEREREEIPICPTLPNLVGVATLTSPHTTINITKTRYLRQTTPVASNHSCRSVYYTTNYNTKFMHSHGSLIVHAAGHLATRH